MLKRVEQSNIVGLLKGNDVTKSKRKQGDGGDGGQKHGGGLNHAADGAGLIPQISDPPERSTCGHRPGRNPPSRFYALRTHIVVSAAYRPFAQGVFYNALVSVADHLQYLLRSRGHMCPAELLLQEGEFLVHSSSKF